MTRTRSALSTIKSLSLFPLTLLLILIPLTSVSASNPCDELSAIRLTDQELGQIEAGQTVVRFQKANGPWPKGFVFQKLNASAIEAMALFSDVSHQKNYFKNMKTSEIVSRLGQGHWRAAFELVLQWPLPNEKFQTEIQIFDYSDFYESRATIVKAGMLTGGEVCARFEKRRAEYPESESTVLSYYTYMTSNHPLAGRATEAVKKQTVEVSKSFVDELLRLKTKDRPLLDRQIGDLEKELSLR